jgi:hypothetical protein
LCTARKRNEVDDFGTGIGGIEFQEGVMEKQKIQLTYSTTASISPVDQHSKR